MWWYFIWYYLKRIWDEPVHLKQLISSVWKHPVFVCSSCLNNFTSRFGKYLQIIFKDGVISGAKLTDYLLEKSRIVTQISEERNYHIFYELLEGLPKEQKDKYGLMSADKYFYLNQGKLKFIH